MIFGHLSNRYRECSVWSDWDIEDGVKLRTGGNKKGSFSKNKERDEQIEKRNISGLKQICRERKRNGIPSGIYHPRQRFDFFV